MAAGGEQCDGGGGQEEVPHLPHHLEGAAAADHDDDDGDDGGDHVHDKLNDSWGQEEVSHLLLQLVLVLMLMSMRMMMTIGGSTCSTCHLCISHRFKLFRQQVTVDPATLAPTGQLDPRAIAWVESLGVKPNQTVEVICPLILTLLNQILFQTGGGRIIN